MQFKSIVNPSFLMVALELQDALLEGWRIDPVKYPAHNLVYFEVNLIRDDAEAVQTTFAEPKKPVGRPAAKGAK